MMKRTRYAVAGGLLGLGAPAGLLFVRLMRHGFSLRSVTQEIEAERESYIYSAASTTVVFALFGGVLGHYADRLAELATTDALTGLFNARAFHERLGQELGRSVRYREPLSLLIVDLDGLKRVNDQYGHEAGDAALRSVVAAIRSGLREIDLGARLGGDDWCAGAPHQRGVRPRSGGAAASTCSEGVNGPTGRGTAFRSGSPRWCPRGRATDAGLADGGC